MSELLELKMSAMPEMDPKQTSERNGLNGLSLGDFLFCITCCVRIEAIHFALQRFDHTRFKCYDAFCSTLPGRWVPTWCLLAQNKKL